MLLLNCVCSHLKLNYVFVIHAFKGAKFVFHVSTDSSVKILEVNIFMWNLSFVSWITLYYSFSRHSYPERLTVSTGTFPQGKLGEVPCPSTQHNFARPESNRQPFDY